MLLAEETVRTIGCCTGFCVAILGGRDDDVGALRGCDSDWHPQFSVGNLVRPFVKEFHVRQSMPNDGVSKVALTSGKRIRACRVSIYVAQVRFHTD